MNEIELNELVAFLNRRIKRAEDKIELDKNLNSSNSNFHWWFSIWYHNWLSSAYDNVLWFIEGIVEKKL